MTAYDPRLLLPPEEAEEIYPYRRVWRSLAVETLILLLVALFLWVLSSFIGFRLPDALNRPLGAIVALLPLGLWFLFSYLPERFAPQPRERLLVIVILSALTANAIGVPLVNDVLQVDRWLPMSSAVTRILGYTFTVGIVHEFIKYIVVHYTVWPDLFRTRLDGVAYGLASAVGYATVLNLHYWLSTNAPPSAVATRVFDTVAVQFAGSILVGFALAEVRFGRPTPLIQTIMLAAAATVAGVVIPVRAGLINATLVLGVSATSPIRGLALSAVVIAAVSLAIGFFTENAERQEREVAAAQDR